MHRICSHFKKTEQYIFVDICFDFGNKAKLFKSAGFAEKFWGDFESGPSMWQNVIFAFNVKQFKSSLLFCLGLLC